MRVTGNTSNWEYRVWEAGLYHRAPEVIDHTDRGDGSRGRGSRRAWRSSWRTVPTTSCPPGDAMLPVGSARPLRRALGRVPRRLLRLARHDRSPGPRPPLAVLRPGDDRPGARRPTWCPDRSPRPPRDGVSSPIAAPTLDRLVRPIHADPAAVAAALAATPQTFVAGDWKLGNLGSRADGRTIVLDWAYPGEAPPCWELAWYLALNCARLPRIEGGHDRRLPPGARATTASTPQVGGTASSVCAWSAIMATFAWEKALGGDEAELAWWERVATGRRSMAVSDAGPYAAWLRRGRGTLGGRCQPRLRAVGPAPRRLQPDPLAGPRRARRRRRNGRAGAVLDELGAHVVETDVEPSMLAHDRADRPPAAPPTSAPFRSVPVPSTPSSPPSCSTTSPIRRSLPSRTGEGHEARRRRARVDVRRQPCSGQGRRRPCRSPPRMAAAILVRGVQRPGKRRSAPANRSSRSPARRPSAR